jgi:hypothetical protein
LKQFGEDQITVYPNPAASELTISNTFGALGFADISVFSISGQLLMKEYERDFSNPIQLNLASLRSGAYYLEIKFKGGTYRKRFSKR